MLVTTMLVASSFTVGKAITDGLDPAVLLLLRYLLATAIFAPIVLAKGLFARPSWGQMAGYGLISASAVGFFWCMFEALRSTSAISTSIIFTLTPGLSGLYSALFLRERLGSQRVFALLCGMGGALWVVFRGDLGRLLAMEVNHGDLLFLGGCLLMAAYTPLIKTFHRQESMLVLTFWVLATGTGWLLLLAAPKLATVDWAGIAPAVWLGTIYLAIFSTVITFYLTHLATPPLGPTRAMAYSYFYPAGVLLIDWGLGHGLPPPIIWPGVIVVSLATLVVQRGPANRHLCRL